MKRILVIHGWGGSPHNDWIGSVRDRLAQRGWEATAPEMPNTDEPKIEPWVQHLREVVGTPDTDTYFVAHSIGCSTVMRYLETLTTPVGGAVFVAPWFTLSIGEDEQTTAKPWLETPIDFSSVRAVLPKLTIFLSEDDPDVPYQENKALFQERLHPKIITIPVAGHFTASDGYATFSQVVDEVEKL